MSHVTVCAGHSDNVLVHANRVTSLHVCFSHDCWCGCRLAVFWSHTFFHSHVHKRNYAKWCDTSVEMRICDKAKLTSITILFWRQGGSNEKSDLSTLAGAAVACAVLTPSPASWARVYSHLWALSVSQPTVNTGNCAQSSFTLNSRYTWVRLLHRTTTSYYCDEVKHQGRNLIFRIHHRTLLSIWQKMFLYIHVKLYQPLLAISLQTGQ